MKNTIKLYLLVVCCVAAISASAKDYLITDYGAKADGKTNNTKAIQKTIDDCNAHGGGKVIVPTGEFLSEMILVKSNVELNLTIGAQLSAIAGGPAYTALVMVEGAENVAITGNGTLFGNGNNFPVKEEAPGRPYIVFVKNSKNVRIENVKLRQSAAWTLRLLGNEQVLIKGVSIYSHVNYNNDGIDIESRDVVITGCVIDSGDDAICLKNDDPQHPTENITITNCIAASNCNLIKMGTSSRSGFKNISISNCVLRHASASPLHHWNDKPEHFIDEPITGISGIALEMVDGGAMDQVSISNISMTGVQTPIFLRLGSRRTPTGTLKNVIINNVVATSHSRMSSIIAGVPGFQIENVTLRDIVLNGPGGGTRADADRKMPESEKEYPENRMFGWTVPASGLYVRHAKNIVIDNFQVQLAKPDERPAIFLEDVQQLKATGLKVNGQPVNDGLVRQVNSSNCAVN